MREGHNAVVGPISGNKIQQPSVSFIDICGSVSAKERVIGRGVEEIDAGSRRGWKGPIDKVKDCWWIQGKFGTESSY